MRQKQIRDYVLEARLAKEHKNEAKLDRGADINFDNVGCGFEVIGVYEFSKHKDVLMCSGYSNNTTKNLAFINNNIDSMEDEEKQKELQKARLAIAKDLKPLADKFDKEVEAVFAKYGFKKA